MSEEANTISTIFSWLTVGSNIFFVFIVFVFLTRKQLFSQKILIFLKQYSYHIAFLLSLGAIVGSLIYSEFIGFEPCFLCWVQRIFLFPLAIIFAIALFKKEKVITTYTFVLSTLGGLVALYHSITQLGGPSFTTCTETGGDCAVVYFIKFGYITIPFMAFSVFLLIATLMSIDKVYLEKSI